jgi:hypothetical protein
VLAIGQSFQRDHIETHRAASPRGAPLQEKSGGANDFSLLTAGHGRGRAAEIDAGSLAHFNDNQDALIEAHEIEFPAFAAQIALEHGEALGLQVLGRELFGVGAVLVSGIGGHAGESARYGGKRQRGFLAGLRLNEARHSPTMPHFCGTQNSGTCWSVNCLEFVGYVRRLA